MDYYYKFLKHYCILYLKVWGNSIDHFPSKKNPLIVHGIYDQNTGISHVVGEITMTSLEIWDHGLLHFPLPFAQCQLTVNFVKKK